MYDDVRDYALQLVERLKIAHAAITASADAQQKKRDEENTAMQHVPSFDIGDLVMLDISKIKPKAGRTKKLTAYWQGPYQIIECYNNRLNYKLQKLDKRGRKINTARSMLVHVGRIKPYLSPSTSSVRSST